MAPPVITAQNLGLTFGSKTIFENLDFSIQAGQHVCLVGRNGTGKSTLLKVLANIVQQDRGTLFIQPGTKISYLAQEPDFDAHENLYQYMFAGLTDDQLGEEYRVDAALSQWDLDPEHNPNQLSGGEKRRLMLARAFMAEPDVILLDEPTNHLDLPTIEKLEKTLRDFRGSFILISHDRAFLNNLTDTTLWLNNGVIRVMNQPYREFDAWSETIMEQEARARRKMDKLIFEETTWSHQGITARRKRNQGRLRRLHELRDQRSEMLRPQGRAKLEIESGSQSGKLIVEAKNISKNFEDRVIIKEFSTRIVRGDRIGIIGPNGAGKSTLLKLLHGEIQPDSGHIRLGKNLTTVYFDQDRQQLDPEKTLWETLCNQGSDQILVQGIPRHVVSYLRDFLFDADQARSPIKSLSGGEKNRLLLAKKLAQPSNILILDEPTNDLDMDTLDLLQETLSEYDGTLIIVSHDRYFLDQTVTATIVFEGDGVLTEYAGGYSDYQRQRKLSAKNDTSAIREQSKAAPTPAPSIVKNTTRLSYKHQRRYQEIPTLIKAIENQIKPIEQQLNASEIGHMQLQQLSQQHQNFKQQIVQLETEWLEIEHLKTTLA